MKMALTVRKKLDNDMYKSIKSDYLLNKLVDLLDLELLKL